MATSQTKIYLPRQITRRGVAGYKGPNVETFDAATGSPVAAPTAPVGTTFATAAPSMANTRAELVAFASAANVTVTDDMTKAQILKALG